jgi:putative Mn2+ efflux pump MntP
VLVYVAVVSFLATLIGLALGRRLGSRLGAAAHGLAGGAFVLLAVVIMYQALSGDSAY